jgi:hypothetical protein
MRKLDCPVKPGNDKTVCVESIAQGVSHLSQFGQQAVK